MARFDKCQLCNQTILDTTGHYCQKCYNYLCNHPEGVYPLPQSGTVALAINGDPICHICGKAYRKLGNHIYQCHHITQQEYRVKFKLHHNTRLSNVNYQQTMQSYNKRDYKVVVQENLIKCGQQTRVSSTNILPGRKIGNNQVKVVQYIKEDYE